MGGARGGRRPNAAPRTRRLARLAALVAAVTVAMSGLGGAVRLADPAKPGPVAAAAVHAGSSASLTAAGQAPGAPPRSQAGGAPGGGSFPAAAPGKLPPPAVNAMNRARQTLHPVTSSAAGRFNVGQTHSPRLLRELAGGPGGPGRPSPPAPATPATADPAGSATPVPSGSAAPAPAISSSAQPITAAVIRPAARAVPAAVTMPQGVDVASYQHPDGAAIGWPQVAAAGYKFASVKVTEGNYYVNPYYAGDIAAARAAGLYVAGYHFAIPNGSSGTNQADYAVANAHYASDGHTLPLELDIEYDPYTATDHTNECYGLSTSAMVSWISAFSVEVQRLTGQLPAIYSTTDWWRTCTGNSGAFGASPLWIAQWSTAGPTLPAGWSTWTLWQYTSTGSVSGIPGNTDLSYFNTGLADPINPGIQRNSAGSAVSVQINSLNATAGQALSFTASGLPAGLSISATGRITGTIKASSGAYNVVVRATGPSAGAGSVSFVWEVTGGVSVPSPGNQTTVTGSPVSLQLSATDSAPGYVPYFTATGLPPGLVISGTGQITGWPYGTGTYHVTVTATDALNVSGSAAFTWTVTTAPDQGPAGPVVLQNGGSCVDDPGGHTASGTRVQIWSCWGGANQRWTVAQDGTLRTAGVCLAESGADNSAAVVLATCDGSSSQQWQVGTNAELVNAASGECLDDTGAQTANGTLLDIWPCTGLVNQHWTPAAAPVMSGIPGKCMDDPAFNTTGGVLLQIYDCTGGGNQDWTVQPDGTIQLAGKCLDVLGGRTADGTSVDLYTCNGGGNQHWILQPEGPVGSEVINPASGDCLADPCAAIGNGTTLAIEPCSSQDPATVWHVQ